MLKKMARERLGREKVTDTRNETSPRFTNLNIFFYLFRSARRSLPEHQLD